MINTCYNMGFVYSLLLWMSTRIMTRLTKFICVDILNSRFTSLTNFLSKMYYFPSSSSPWNTGPRRVNWSGTWHHYFHDLWLFLLNNPNMNISSWSHRLISTTKSSNSHMKNIWNYWRLLNQCHLILKTIEPRGRFLNQGILSLAHTTQIW